MQDPALIVAGIDALGDHNGGGLAEETVKAERELRAIQMEEDRAIRLYVSGKITEDQLDLQRKFITERLEGLRAKVDDYRARQTSGAKKRELTEVVLAWSRDVGEGLDELTPEQRKEVLQMVVEEVTVDRENNLDITLAIPVDDESVAIASQPSPRGGGGGEGESRLAPLWDVRRCAAGGLQGLPGHLEAAVGADDLAGDEVAGLRDEVEDGVGDVVGVAEIVSVIATLQDMTPLEELERLRAEFLGMVSHELRMPLTAIKGSAASALSSTSPFNPAEAYQFFRIIDEQADHMRSLINDLLDVTRIEAGALS